MILLTSEFRSSGEDLTPPHVQSNLSLDSRAKRIVFD